MELAQETRAALQKALNTIGSFMTPEELLASSDDTKKRFVALFAAEADRVARANRELLRFLQS